ncbi:MAG: TetR/AcrR family transcriptional regulator [Sulfitobacter sp.]|nr:TetR/AcrR family transcriptional regulator [Sulfitobacter sp.]
MSGKNGGRGVSKAQWLEKGLEALSTGGASALTIEGLARSLGIARAGFYWHFKGRDDLLKQLLDHWIAETTAVITADERLLALDPKARLTRVAEMVIDHNLERYDMAFRQWALAEARAMRAVRKVNRLRLEFVGGAFGELGFTGDELEMRTLLFVCYHTWEASTFRELSRKRRRALIEKRIELLTRR